MKEDRNTMRDLTPVRLTGSGTQLVLVDGNAVPIARIHQVLGNARGRAESATGTTSATPTPGIRKEKVEQKMESTLRPRDIQTRIRAGESPEDVAAVAGSSVEKVMIFAAPVLAERAHIARSAQSASVRRTSSAPASTVRTLGPAAGMRLREEGVDPESVEWDAWRREDGRWTMVATYHHDGEARRALFVFDQPGHFVTADDDEGRWLVGDGQFPSREQKAQASQRRLTPVPRYDEELPLGDDAIELVRGERPSEEVEARRAHPEPAAPDSVSGDADWIAPERPHGEALHASAWVADAAPAAPRPDVETDETPDPADETPEPVLPVAQEPEPEEDVSLETEPEDDHEPSAKRAAARKGRGRASVPTWDEIMFGGGRGD